MMIKIFLVFLSKNKIYSPKHSSNTVSRAEVSISNHTILAQFCKDHQVGLVVVGPEVPLAAGSVPPVTSTHAAAFGLFLQPSDFCLPGIVDDLKAAGVPCFGPSAKAAQLEASKSFSKVFMERQGIPTARYGSFSDPQEACSFIHTSVRTEAAHI